MVDDTKKPDDTIEEEGELEVEEETAPKADAEDDAAGLFDDEADDTDPNAGKDPKSKRVKNSKKPAKAKAKTKPAKAAKAAKKSAPVKKSKAEDDGIDAIIKGLNALGGEASVMELYKHLLDAGQAKFWGSSRGMRTVMHDYPAKITRTSNTTWAIKGKEGSRKPVEKKAPAKKAASKKAAKKPAKAKKAPKKNIAKGTKGDKSRKKR